jgi:acetyl-CoA C-acetyltransferase
MPSLQDVFLYEAIRTPRGRGKANGALHTQTPVGLVTVLLQGLVSRHPGLEHAVDEVILGCCEQYNDQGANLARSGAIQAGYALTTPGVMVSRFCGSALDAVNIGAAKVMAGQNELVIAGGVEMLSLFTIFGSGGPLASDVAFKDKVVAIPQGLSADLIATRQGYSRSDVDAYAAASQQRASAAWKNGWFQNSVLPVRGGDNSVVLARDELVRDNVTVSSLAKLPPSFQKAGEEEGYAEIVRFRYPEVGPIRYVHHAGNSSGIADGAGIVLLGNAEAGTKLGLKARAKIVSTASAADDPCIMLTAPAASTRRALDRLGLRFSDVDLYEVNEAFASVVLYFMERTKIPHEKINVVGGSIAMGHPVGATGAMLLGTLVDELERRGLERGVATMCTGLGMGVATVIERV